MAATAASPASTPPTPPSGLPLFARVTSASLLQRNASTSSSVSTATSESTSSLVAVPMRPPPIQTRTAATPEVQLPSDNTADYDEQEPRGMYGGRGFLHNGPRMARQSSPIRAPSAPAIVTTGSSSHTTISPTTPRAPRLPLPDALPAPVPMSPGALRVTIADDDMPGTPARPRNNSNPATPTTLRVAPQSRNQSMDGNLQERERRQSQVSTHSTSSTGSRRPSLRDYVLGEELGRGSYSTVVRATSATPSPREYAIKIMNQAHLIQEKKAKYAHIERDALIRLSLPRPSMSPTLRAGHRRGLSGSSAGTNGNRKSGAHKRRDSGSTVTNATVTSPQGGTRDRLLESPHSTATPLSPLAGGVRSLTREPQEYLDDRPSSSSNVPSPVKEELSDGQSDAGNASEPMVAVASRRETEPDSLRARTPRKRRQSLAPSERSTKSVSGTQSLGHPGVIRLYCTFADKTSVYYVLELAANGELATVIRKYGSLDVAVARYYAAQLIDTLEFIHEREIIHRDIKPENILLDADMRIKVTDFGSAKILGRKEEAGETSKRSFVGSADYVSPEVLRNEPATYASDIWAFGVVLFDFITGKSPFRSATEFLTFQKVLKREIDFPEGFDVEARSLIELCLDLNAATRPTAQDIKSHPFFAKVDWTTIWSIPAPKLHTGMSPPVETLAQLNLDSDVWAVFDDAASDGPIESLDVPSHAQEPQYDRYAAASAVRAVDHPENHLDPPRPAWLDDDILRIPRHQHKPRGWSTSSSSSGGRLSGLLDSIGINPPFTPNSLRAGSGRASRMSDRDDMRVEELSPSRTQSPEAARLIRGVTHTDNSRWIPLLQANERIVLSTPINVRASNNVPLPSFLLPSSKRRQLLMTDLPRLLLVKDDTETGEPRVKVEFGFLSHPSYLKGSGRSSQSETAVQAVIEIQEKGSKVFILQTATQAFTFLADTADIRSAWMHTFRRVV